MMETEQIEREHCYSESAYVQEDVVRLHHLANLKQPPDMTDEDWAKSKVFIKAFIEFVEDYL